MTNENDLVEALRKYFDLHELRTLCFKLGVNFDDLPNTQGTLTGSAIALVQLMERQSNTELLLDVCTAMRPNVNWQQYAQPQPPLVLQSSTLNQIKRGALQKRLQELTQEYEACYTQVSQALSEVEKVRLNRTLASLETEIKEVETDLNQLDTE